MNLVDQYKQLHTDEKFYSSSVLNIHKESIRQYIQIYKCESILDYGCAKATQYFVENIHNESFFGILPSLYDPAVEQYSILPEGKFDAVISTDVLEHIEKEDLNKVIQEIYSKANKFVYLGVCNIPAVATLVDGRNAHVTLESFDWWHEKILSLATVDTLLYVYGKGGGVSMIENGIVKFKKSK